MNEVTWIKNIVDSIGIWNAISLSVGILGVILTIRSIKKMKPSYSVRNIKLFSEKIQTIDDLNVLWQGKPLKNLTLSRVLIWNRGREPIRRADIAPADCIRIGVDPESEIIACKVDKCSNNSNNFHARIENKIVVVDFDFISFKEGAIIDIYHTGTIHDQIFFSGTIIGIGNFQYILDDEDQYWRNFRKDNVDFCNYLPVPNR